MEDNQIIDLYWARDQRAIDETSGKYGGFLLQLAWNILRSHADAEECVNDTYLHTWNAIPPARPSALKLWLGRIARNLSLDRWKWTRAQKRGGAGMEVLLGELDDCVPTSHSPERCLEDQFQLRRHRIPIYAPHYPRRQKNTVHCRRTGIPVSYTHLDVYKRQE